MRIDLVGTTADFRGFGPPPSLPINHLLCENPQTAGRIGEDGLKDNDQLAVKNACADKQRSPNCVGENISPPLAWSGAPEGTKSFAIVMLDPEGRAPAGVVHMVIYGIPGDVKAFAEGELSKESEKFVGGKSTMEKNN